MPTESEVKKVAEWLRCGAKPDAIIGEAIISGEWTCVSLKDLKSAADKIDSPEKLRLWVVEPPINNKRGGLWLVKKPDTSWTEYAPIEKVRDLLRKARGKAAACNSEGGAVGFIEAALKEIE